MQLSKIKNHKQDIICISIIAIISIFFLHKTVGTETLMDNGHYLHEQTFFSYNYKEAFSHNTLPFWTNYWYSGQPLYGDPQVFFLNLTALFVLLFKNVFLSIGLSTLVYFFLAGVGMYLLAKELTKSHHAALLSSIVYMFNALIYNFLRYGNPSILEPYSLIPFIFLLVFKATKSENYLIYSVFAGILMAFQIYSGGMIIFLYTGILIVFFLIFNLIGRHFTARLKKSFAIGLVVLIVCIGVAAIKIMPNLDFVSFTNRAGKLSYQEYIGNDKFVMMDFFRIVPFNGTSTSLVVHIGLLPFLFALLSVTQFRKRTVLFLLFFAIFSLIFATGGGLAEFFYKIPGFSQTRHVSRALFSFVFAASVLAAYGFIALSNLIKTKIKSHKINLMILSMIIIIAMAELISARPIPKGVNVAEQISQNHLANYMKEDNDKFRINTFDVTDLISFYGSSYYAQYGLETVSGGGALWINDFIEYLAIANNYNPSKLLGILNVKYITSTKEAKVPGFKLVRKFEECKACRNSEWTVWIDGPYLYENENFLSRYYTVNNSVLVVGRDPDAKAVLYNLLLNENFNPKSTVVIKGKEKIDDYSIDELRNYNVVMLTRNSAGSASIPLLNAYAKQNGILLPDLTNNKFNLEPEELNNVLKSLKGNPTKADIKYFSQNKVVIEPKKSGFLVLSEKFYMFPDWRATQGNKNIDLLQANGVVSSVLANNNEEINFTYMPRSFARGLLITSMTLVIIFIYIFIYIVFYHARKSRQNKIV